MKSRITRSFTFDEVQKIPLRHKAEKLTVRRQMSQVCERDKLLANLAADLANFLLGAFEKLVDQTEFVDDFKRGRMNCIAAKITQEVSVLLEDDYRNSGTRQQKPEHHSSRPTTDDATTGFDHARWLSRQCICCFHVRKTIKFLRPRV